MFVNKDPRVIEKPFFLLDTLQINDYDVQYLFRVSTNNILELRSPGIQEECFCVIGEL
jgi:hypothetical protein